MVILGLDPGGEKPFGWCVAQTTNNGHLQLRAWDIASYAAGAVAAALRKAEYFGRVTAAGIDSRSFGLRMVTERPTSLSAMQ
jgi:hypothetical protein